MTDRLEEIRADVEHAGGYISLTELGTPKHFLRNKAIERVRLLHAPYLLAEVERLREGIADFAPKCYCSGPRAYTASWAEECPNIEDCAYIATLLDRPNYAAEEEAGRRGMGDIL